jgi:cytochrome c2
LVAGFLTVILTVFFIGAPAGAVPARQLCLACHPAHYSERGTCTACHRGNPASNRKNIAHQNMIAARYARFSLGLASDDREGDRLLDQYACRRCHVIGGRGNRLSVNLDHATARKAPEELERSILKPVGNMPDFHINRSQSVAIVNSLLAAAINTPGSAMNSGPQVVHFDRSDGAGQDIFSKKCGSCHRALTARMGALGSGDAGPNLSGLMSPYYPQPFKAGTQWTERNLEKWLKNPRAVKPWSTMQPVSLTDVEFRELMGLLKVDAAGTK